MSQEKQAITSHKLGECKGRMYRIRYNGSYQELIVATMTLTDVQHIGVPLFIFNGGELIVNANKIIDMKEVRR